MGNKSTKYWIIAIILTLLSIALNAFIIYQSCLNGADSSTSSGFVVNALKSMINTFVPNAINDDNIGQFSNVVRKLIGHFGLFAASGLITTIALDFWFKPWVWYKNFVTPLLSLLTGVSLAALTEIIQHFTPNRSGEFKDVLIDSAGYLLGCALMVLFIFLVTNAIKKRQAKKQISEQNPVI